MSAGARETGLTSIVIVAADSGPLLLEAVGTALASTAPVEVILADNASSDGMPERAASMHGGDPRLRVLPIGANIGFGPACNRAAAIARGDAVLILNPDCRIEPGAIARLREIATRDGRFGVLGIEIRSPDGTPARGNRRRDPSLRRALMTMSGLARFESRWPVLAGVEMPAQLSGEEIEDVEAVSGAFMLLPRSVFDALGGFDEAYFLHVEDLDLCRRARDAGYRVAIVHTIHATHAQGSSSRHRALFVERHKHRGMWRYFRKFDPAARNPMLRAIVWLGIWTHYLLKASIQAVRGRRH